MPVFTYTASDTTAAVVSGTITADTARQARDQLRARGLLVQRVGDHGAASAAAPAKWRRRRGRRFAHKTVLFVRELSTLLGVGVPLLEALDTVARQHRGPFQAVVLTLRDRVVAGIGLAEAMREQGDVFDEMVVNLTETGEDAGNLELTLERLAEFRERAAQLRGRVANALIYPGIIMVVATGVMLFLMTFVVPRIIEPMIEQGQELPTATVLVKGISDLLLGYWWALLAAAIAVALGVTSVLRTDRGRWHFHRLLLRLPLLGDLLVKQAIVRITVVMGTLLKSGIVFVRALQIAQRSTRNVVIRDALERCEKAVSAGGDISEGLAETGVFPPLVVQVFSVGQQSGRLEEMLDRLAHDYDAQVNLVSQRVAAVLEPLLIIFIAIIVLFIVLATVLPMLEAANVLT